MALTALDDDRPDQPAGYYFGGHDYLAETVHGRVDAGTRREVRRDLATLTAAGLVEPVTRAANGTRAVYRVVVDLSGGPGLGALGRMLATAREAVDDGAVPGWQ